MQLIALEGLGFNALESLGVFLMAYFPFRMWYAYQAKKASFYVYNNRTFVKFIFIMILQALMQTGLAYALNGYDTSRAFTIVDMWCVFSELFLFPTILGMPLLMLWQKLSPVRYVRYKDENQNELSVKAIKLLVALNVLYIISLLAGFMSSVVASLFSIVGLMLFCLCCNVPSKYEPHELETSGFHSISKNVIDDIIGGSAIIAVTLYIALMFYYHDYIVVLDSQKITLLFYSTIYLILIMFCVGVYGVLLNLEANFVRKVTALSKKAMAYEFSETATSNIFEDGLDTETANFNEVGVLQKTLAQADVDLRAYVAHMTESNDERSKVEGQLAIAQSIQGGLLPDVNKLQQKLTGYKLMVGFEPTEYVCGDMYDCYMLDDDHLMLLVADADAKGVLAALFMMITLALIKNNAEIASPGKILEKVNRSLARRNNEMISVTMWLGIVELSTGKITYVSAGHNPPLLKDNATGKAEYLRDKSGLVLGLMPRRKYKVFERVLKPDSMLYLYTDGISEARDVNKDFFGEPRLQEAVETAQKPEDVLAKVHEFVGEVPQSDDMTYICLMREKGMEMNILEEKEFQITAEHMEEILSWCNNHIDSLLTNRKAAMRMRLVMEEAIVNVFRYAYQGSDKTPLLKLKVGKDGEYLAFEMADQGVPFNPLENITADPNLKLFERTEGGWGRSIMVSFTDASEYDYKDGWNVLTMKKLDTAPVIVNKKRHLAK